MQNEKPRKLSFTLRALRWFFPKYEAVFPGLAYRWATNLFLSPVRFPWPKGEQAMLEKAERSQLTVEDYRVEVYAWGEGPVVIMTHGWSGRGTQWYRFIEPLNKMGYRVVTFDAPGHGHSSGKRSNLLLVAATLKALLKQQKMSVAAYAGHSLGGIATLFAIEEGIPARPSVLISVPAISSEITKWFRITLNGSAKLDAQIEKGVEKLTGRKMETISAVEIAKRIPAFPTLILHDEKDMEARIFQAEALHAVMPHATFIRTNGHGHTRILRADEIIQHLTSFIEKEAPIDKAGKKSSQESHSLTR